MYTRKEVPISPTDSVPEAGKLGRKTFKYRSSLEAFVNTGRRYGMIESSVNSVNSLIVGFKNATKTEGLEHIKVLRRGTNVYFVNEDIPDEQQD